MKYYPQITSTIFLLTKFNIFSKKHQDTEFYGKYDSSYIYVFYTHEMIIQKYFIFQIIFSTSISLIQSQDVGSYFYRNGLAWSKL